MQFSLCIDSIYPEENLKEKLEKIKQAGFKFIEFWDWRDKDYFLDNFRKTLELIQSVNSEHLKILYDIYHMQIMERNVLETLQKYHQFIGYVHVANVPYRCEPWIGELEFKFILKELSKVYSGFVGFEFFVKEKSFTYEKLYKWIHSIDF